MVGDCLEERSERVTVVDPSFCINPDALSQYFSCNVSAYYIEKDFVRPSFKSQDVCVTAILYSFVHYVVPPPVIVKGTEDGASLSFATRSIYSYT